MNVFKFVIAHKVDVSAESIPPEIPTIRFFSKIAQIDGKKYEF